MSLGIVLAVIVALSGYAFVSLPWHDWRSRAIVAGLFCALAGAAIFGYSETLSRPKPARLEFLRAGNAEVLSHVLIEGRAIYLWLRLPGVAEPRAYAMPWDRETAEGLLEALKQSQGAPVEALLPFAWSWENRRPQKFQTLPQPKLPDKMGQEPPAEWLPEDDI